MSLVVAVEPTQYVEHDEQRALMESLATDNREGSLALDDARELMRSVQELVVHGPRAALMSRDGYHRPHTRGGGYNRPSHDKIMAELPVANIGRKGSMT